MKKRRSSFFSEKMNQERSSSERLADNLTLTFGSLPFFVIHVLFFLFWIVANSGIWQGFVFDPYPFSMLTTMVSLEAIFLSIFVLMSQNRAARIADIREELDFQVNVQAEKEITQILHVLDEMRHALKVPHTDDQTFRDMEQSIDLDLLETKVARAINKN